MENFDTNRNRQDLCVSKIIEDNRRSYCTSPGLYNLSSTRTPSPLCSFTPSLGSPTISQSNSTLYKNNDILKLKRLENSLKQ